MRGCLGPREGKASQTINRVTPRHVKRFMYNIVHYNVSNTTTVLKKSHKAGRGCNHGDNTLL